jgi:hypothetical protein
MTANPNPLHAAIVKLPSDCAVVIPHAHRKSVPPAGEPFVVQGMMLRIFKPEPIVLLREFLNLLR